MGSANVQVFSIELSLGVPDSIWTITVWTNPSQSVSYTVPSDLAMADFFALFEEMTTKIVQAGRARVNAIAMQTSGSHLIRDKSFSLPSDTVGHLVVAMNAVKAADESIRAAHTTLVKPHSGAKRSSGKTKRK